MTILSALARLYDRMQDAGDAPRPGYSSEKISFAVVLDADGRPLRLADKRGHAGKKPAPVVMVVPAGSRTSGIKPNLLWDKTAYVFGITAVEEESEDGEKLLIPGQGKRTADEHAAFVSAHRELLADASDPGLVALRRFFDCWRPEMFTELGFNPDALDQNIVFEFDDGGGPGFVHERLAAVALLVTPSAAERGLCLVTGEHLPIADKHEPKIKGVRGAQPTGALLVSFNDTAYESYGKSSGDNAPVSERAAFAYGTALNTLLAYESERKLLVGDTTVVFWAEAERRGAAATAENAMWLTFQPPDDDAELNTLRTAITDVASGRPADPDLDPSTRVYMLGLAPNAARLSVRFWYPGTFGDFARHVARFWEDLRIEPAPWKGPPASLSLLYETAIRVGGRPKAETIPPLLGGQVVRSVLTGQPLPRTLLSAVIARIRADGEINGRRAAICKAVMNAHRRDRRGSQTAINPIPKKEEIPVSLDPDSTNPAYCLGRLFAAYAYAELSFTKRNSTIRDKYLAGASANPARVFPLLMRGYEHNRSGLMKATDKRRGYGVKADKTVATILELLDGGINLPVSLTMDEQAKFFVGFYHQSNAFFDKPEEAAEAAAEIVETEENDQ